MSESNLTRAKAESRPLVTLFVTAFNQEDMVRAAVEGALAQTYSPLEIILSDDCSADRTYEIMVGIAEGYSGPHEVRLNRNERNLGIVGHVNRMFELGSGELFVAAAGDDISFPDRVESLVDHWVAHDKKPDGLCSGFVAATGAKENFVPGPTSLDAESHCRKGLSDLLGATAAWSRRLFERWGNLPEEGLVEDQVLTLRALLGGGIVCLQRPLVWLRREREVNGRPPSWRSRELWRLQRIEKFLAVYMNDLQHWDQVASSPGDQCEHFHGIARNTLDVVGRDVRFLGRGRVSVVAYAVLHAMGRTYRRGSPRAQLLRASALLKQCCFGETDNSFLDANDHRGLRRGSRAGGDSNELSRQEGRPSPKGARTAAAFRAVGVSYLTRALTILLGFLVTPIVLGYVGRDLYGFWAIVGSVIGYVGMVDFGITGSVATLIAREQRSVEAVNRIGSNALLALSFAGLLVIAVSAVASPLVPVVLRVPSAHEQLVSELILLAGIGLGLSFPVRGLKSVLRGTQRIATLRTMDFGLSLFRMGTMLGLLYLGHGIMALPWSMILTSIVGAVLFFVVTRRVVPDFSIRFSLISRSELVTILNVSAWWFLGTVGALFIYQTDNIIIGRYLGAAVVTSYALTFRVPDMMRTQIYQLNLAIAPGVGDMVGRQEQKNLQALFGSAIRIVLFLGISGAFLIVKLNRGFVTLWVGAENYGGDVLSVLFSGTLLFLVFFHLSSIILTNHLDLKVVAITRFIEGLLNLGLSLVLVQTYGAEGVAAATLIAGLCTSAWFLPGRAARLLEMNMTRFFGVAIGRSMMFAAVAAVGFWLIPEHGAPSWSGLGWRAALLGGWLIVAGWWTILPRQSIRNRMSIFLSRGGDKR